MSDAPIVTTELRWFFDGGLPTEVASWLASERVSSHRPLQRAMEDRYLWTGRDDRSLKLRDTDLESKRRTARRRFAQSGLEGWLETWEKTSRPKELDDEVRPLVTIVHKKRRSLIFEGREGRLRALDEADGAPPIVVELASVAVPAHRGWTFCVEANEGFEDLIEPAVAHLAESFPDARRPSLVAATSMGYPSWLRRHAPEPKLDPAEAAEALPDAP